MAGAMTYEDFQEYYYGSAHLIALTLKARCRAVSALLYYRARKLNLKTRKIMPSIYVFMEEHPDRRAAIARGLKDLHELLQGVLKHYNECPHSDRLFQRSRFYWEQTAQAIEDCLESAQISSDPEIMQEIQKALQEKSCPLSNWRKELAQL